MKKFVVSLVSALTLLAPTQVLAEDWLLIYRVRLTPPNAGHPPYSYRVPSAYPGLRYPGR